MKIQFKNSSVASTSTASLTQEDVDALNSAFGLASEIPATDLIASLTQEDVGALNSAFGLASEAPSDDLTSTLTQENVDALNEAFGLTTEGSRCQESRAVSSISMRKAGLERVFDGSVVVMTGTPPKGFTKDKFFKEVLSKLGAQRQEPSFTRRTNVVVYEMGRVETSKLKAAKKAGIYIFSYSECLEALEDISSEGNSSPNIAGRLKAQDFLPGILNDASLVNQDDTFELVKATDTSLVGLVTSEIPSREIVNIKKNLRNSIEEALKGNHVAGKLENALNSVEIDGEDVPEVKVSKIKVKLLDKGETTSNYIVNDEADTFKELLDMYQFFFVNFKCKKLEDEAKKNPDGDAMGAGYDVEYTLPYISVEAEFVLK